MGVLILTLLVHQLGAGSTDQWGRTAEAELRAIHEIVGEHHPGPIDSLNPEFRRWHERGLRKATALAKQVVDADGFEYAVRYYVNGFQDGHLSIDFDSSDKRIYWPGFVVALREDKVVVHSVEGDDESALPVGAEIVSCDHVGTRELVARNVMPFTGRPFLPSNWIQRTPAMLFDFGNPFVERPRACKLLSGDRHRTVSLNWRPVRFDRVQESYARAGLGSRGTVAFVKLSDGGVWIRMPSFGMGGDQADALQAAIEKLSEYRHAPYVVADVRGNGGGSSHWALVFVERLYGKVYADHLRAKADAIDGYVEYRVSRDNVAHFREFLPQIRERAGEESEFYRYFHRVTEGMHAALERGDDLYSDRRSADRKIVVDDAPMAKFGGTLYFLSDGYCASACLDFADVIYDLPLVVHVGQHTSADTTYMEIRRVALPSGRAWLNFATKVARGRRRAHNEFYTPTHIFRGDIWHSEAVCGWLLSLRGSESTQADVGCEKLRQG